MIGSISIAAAIGVGCSSSVDHGERGFSPFPTAIERRRRALPTDRPPARRAPSPVAVPTLRADQHTDQLPTVGQPADFPRRETAGELPASSESSAWFGRPFHASSGRRRPRRHFREWFLLVTIVIWSSKTQRFLSRSSFGPLGPCDASGKAPRPAEGGPSQPTRSRAWRRAGPNKR